MIELRHLRQFIAVAEELSFRRAAERIHIDQTPLSRTIRDLEDQLGVQLFLRVPRRLNLTPAGVCLLQEAREVLIRVERAQRAVRETDSRFRAPLRIGVADGLAQPKLSNCLANWRNVAPEVHLELTEMRALELAQALQREELDAGFSFGILENDALTQQPAWSYAAMALLPVDHELASRSVLNLAELTAFPMLSYHSGRQPGMSQQLRMIIQRHARASTIIGEACTLNGYVTRVGAGMGVGLVDAGHTSALCRSDVIAVRLLEDEPITTFVLYKNQPFDMPKILQRFIAHAKAML